MKVQELMLNDNVNLNFQYDNKVYKLKVNIHNGIIIVEELKAPNESELLNVILLKNETSKVYEVEVVPCTEEQKVIESEHKENKPKKKRKKKRK